MMHIWSAYGCFVGALPDPKLANTFADFAALVAHVLFQIWGLSTLGNHGLAKLFELFMDCKVALMFGLWLWIYRRLRWDRGRRRCGGRLRFRGRGSRCALRSRDRLLLRSLRFCESSFNLFILPFLFQLCCRLGCLSFLLNFLGLRSCFCICFA